MLRFIFCSGARSGLLTDDQEWCDYISYQITLSVKSPFPVMPVNVQDLESAIRNAFEVAHLEIHDQSRGCGESYSIVLVSDVRRVYPVLSSRLNISKSLLDFRLDTKGIRGPDDVEETSTWFVLQMPSIC